MDHARGANIEAKDENECLGRSARFECLVEPMWLNHRKTYGKMVVSWGLKVFKLLVNVYIAIWKVTITICL